jgi:dTDP-4-amino-4,6-dideoxygalactose transaminase
MPQLQMIDLQNQYLRIKDEIDEAVLQVMNDARFIKGPQVKDFEKALAAYHRTNDAVTCGNGTDALQIALMTLEVKPGDEIILPAFTYVATAEVIALLGLKPVFVDVDYQTFNIDASLVEEKITSKTKAIIAVNLFGQCAQLDYLRDMADYYNIFLIEDNAQSIGATFHFDDGTTRKAGTIGDIGCVSFFPSKNLGCFGDGGAMLFKDPELADRARMIANHGQREKYNHEIVGCNSRLDTIQAAVLKVKLKYLDGYNRKRQEVVSRYNHGFAEISEITTPVQVFNSTHVHNQYTLKVHHGLRDELKTRLKEKGIPSMVYYPRPLHLQEAYQSDKYQDGSFPVAEKLCQEVLSLPLHTELNRLEQDYIIKNVKAILTEMKQDVVEPVGRVNGMY